MFVSDYPELARALLEYGDAPSRISQFLRLEYGLDPDQAAAAIRLARQLIEEAQGERVARARVRRRPVAITD
jgi:hypothetical protein